MMARQSREKAVTGMEAEKQCRETCQRLCGVDVAAGRIILANRPVWLYQKNLEGLA